MENSTSLLTRRSTTASNTAGCEIVGGHYYGCALSRLRFADHLYNELRLRRLPAQLRLAGPYAVTVSPGVTRIFLNHVPICNPLKMQILTFGQTFADAHPHRYARRFWSLENIDRQIL